jgi:hypothetical protein
MHHTCQYKQQSPDTFLNKEPRLKQHHIALQVRDELQFTDHAITAANQLHNL